MREVIFDTETTGLNPLEGHRIVEIGCIETVAMFPTGRTFHAYVNPERDMPPEAYAVHKISAEFLADKPTFAAIASKLHAFLSGARLVAHNAPFDMGFLNWEFETAGFPPIGLEHVVDTAQLARRKFPGARATLDALCDRFGIDRSRRTQHGALLDAELLAEVYAELQGGRQTALSLDARAPGLSGKAAESGRIGPRPTPLPPALTEAEAAAHAAFVEQLGEKALWRRYIRPT